jgi:hypothetical protein
MLAALVAEVKEEKDLLRDLLREIARDRLADRKVVERKWLTIGGAAEYCGMSEKWVRALEGAAPPGTFTKVKGTVFVNRSKLDRFFEAGIRDPEAPGAVA